MSAPQIRIFPHGQEEFLTEDALVTWLLNGLRARGGVYRFRTESRVKELPRGSVVLFRHGQKIVGEAVVRVEKQAYATPQKDKTLAGELVEYEGEVTFAPSSIRLYSPPISVERIEPFAGKNLTNSAVSYTELDWSVYASLLGEIMSSGAFIF